MLNFNCFTALQRLHNKKFSVAMRPRLELHFLVVTGDSDKIYEVDYYLLCSLFKIAIKVLQIGIIDE